jgi:RimJ/RimL family protein N-acetyltransferase
MHHFEFINLKDCPEADGIHLNDLYYEAKIIDSPRDLFKNLTQNEQTEILELYRSGKFFKIVNQEELIGFIGHGTKILNTVMIFYIFFPEFRGKGLFTPMIGEFIKLCKEMYPDKKFLRANTEASNFASINSLERAGFQFLEEKLDGPSDHNRVVFRCYVRKII